MSSNVILRAPVRAREELDECENKLKEIDNFKIVKIKGLFSSKKNRKEKLNKNKKILEECGERLYLLGLKYHQDKPLLDEIKKLSNKVNKLCESYGVKNDFTKNGTQAYGSLIEKLIEESLRVIDNTSRALNNSSEASSFVNVVGNHHRELKKTLLEKCESVEYVDVYNARIAAIAIILVEFFYNIHWDGANKSQDKISKQISKLKKKVSGIRKDLGEGKKDWEEAYRSLVEIYNTLKPNKAGISTKFTEEFKKESYLSSYSMKETFDNGKVIDSIMNGENFKNFKLKELDNDDKNYVRKNVQEKLKPVFDITEVNSLKQSIMQILKSSYEALTTSFDDRKKFEEVCKKAFLKRIKSEGILGYDTEENDDVTVYDIAKNTKSIKEIGPCGVLLLCYYNYWRYSCRLRGSNEHITKIVNEIWKFRGCYYDKGKWQRVDLPGAIKLKK